MDFEDHSITGTSIKYVKGDILAEIRNLTPSDPDAPTVLFVPHIVNNVGHYGGGFTGALNKDPAFAYIAADYAAWIRPGTHTLGLNQNVTIPRGLLPGLKTSVIVVNMMAQDNMLPWSPDRRRVDYVALSSCIDELQRDIEHVFWNEKTAIWTIKFGTGIGGGDWNVIEPLIVDGWCKYDIPVTVFEL